MRIKVNLLEFEMAYMGVVNAESEFASTDKTITDITSQSEAMKAFIGRIETLKEIKVAYQDLLARDCEALKDAETKMEFLDNSLAGVLQTVGASLWGGTSSGGSSSGGSSSSSSGSHHGGSSGGGGGGGGGGGW